MRKVRVHRLLLTASLLLLLSGMGLWRLYAALIVGLPSPDELYRRRRAPSTRLLDRHGRLLYEIVDPHAGRHTPLTLDQIPLYCRQATIATEDANFYRNPGVDPLGILRAAWINLRGGEVLAGGSTITQQLARNLLLDPQERQQRTLTRKLRETILAWRLARRYGKDEILTLYLNETYYGNFAYGIEAAANVYFGKSAADLDLAECALLAGLPQAPAAYDPLVNPQAARRRQAVVLDLMVRQGYVTPDEARLAKREPLHFAATPFPIEAPHFVMFVREWLEERYGLEAIYRQGLVVTTTLDLDWQWTAEAIVRRHLNRLGSERPDPNVHNAALVALDPRTGEVLAMVGSPDYFDPRIDGAVNGALALRQPGSAIKPLTYAAAFDPTRPHPLTPASVIPDVRTSFPTREGLPYVPTNYDRRFHGPVSARVALASSYNVPAVRVLQEVGLDRMIGLARELGVTTFTDPTDYGLAITLGGGEVRLLDLTAVYAAFANGGRRVNPIAVLEVADASGRRLYRADLQLGPQVLDPRVAYLITHILSDDQARAPAFGRGSVLRLSRPAAAKTGTTTDWRDNWTLGYTPDLAVGVWVGNADNSPMQNISGITGAGPIWHDFMEAVLQGRPPLSFPEPPGLEWVEVCSLSGMLPSPACPHRRRELFIAGTAPTEVDTWHRLVRVDRRTGEPATPETPPDQVEERVVLILPEELREWARQQGWEVGLPDGGRVGGPSEETRGRWDDGAAIVLTHPDPGTIYWLSPTLPPEAQQVPVAARPGDGVSLVRVTLYADGRPLATFDRPPYRTFWPLTPGEHRFVARGRTADGEVVESRPVTILVRPSQSSVLSPQSSVLSP